MPDKNIAAQIEAIAKKTVSDMLKNAGIVVPRSSGIPSSGIGAPTRIPQPNSTAPATTSQYRESRVISGFDLLATNPPNGTVTLTNRKISPGQDNISQGISNGIYVELKGEQTIGLDSYMPSTDSKVIYIAYDSGGSSVLAAPPDNKLICGKVIFQKGSLAISNDYSIDSMNGYIISSKDPFFDNNARLDDSTITAFKNALTQIFAENIFGKITLSDSLVIGSADGSARMDGDSYSLYDSNSNLIARFNKKGIFFYDTSGILLASFGPQENFISVLSIINDKLMEIRDSSGTTRVKLGMLNAYPKQEWGFELFSESGRAYMSTTRNRQFFLGAKISSRLLAVPLYAMLMSTLASTEACIGQNDMDRSPYSSFGVQTVDTGHVATVAGIVFEGYRTWFAGNTSGNIYESYLDIFDIDTMAKQTIDLSGDGYVGSFQGICYAKNYMWIILNRSSANNIFDFYAINIHDPTSIVRANTITSDLERAYTHIVFDGLYLYAFYHDTTYTYSTYCEKYSINSDLSLTLQSSTIVATVELYNPYSMFDGSAIWTQDPANNKLYKILTSDMSVTTYNVTAGYGPAFDGRYLWIVDTSSSPDNIKKVDPTTGSVMATIYLNGNDSGYPLFDGKDIYVATGSGGTMERIDIVDNIQTGEEPIANSYFYAVFEGLNLWSASTAGVVQRTPIGR